MRIVSRLFLTLILLISNTVAAQNFSGSVVNSVGTPVPGASVYIKELRQGLICNNEGNFQATLPAATYNVEINSIGFQSYKTKIQINNTEKTLLNAVLQEDVYQLNSLVVKKSEDPAYNIMRKAMEAAPYHRKRLLAFEADCYIKCNFELLKVSSLIDRVAKIEENESGAQFKLSDLKNRLFLQESDNNLVFTAPDKYVQTVKAFSSSIPDDFNPQDAMTVMRGSLYNSIFLGCISPLNEKAMSYYKFRYEGFTEDDMGTVNKIKIIPRFDNIQLMKGYIYIAENTWDIRSAEIEAQVMGLKQTYNVNYENVERDLYLPVTYYNRVDIDMLGVNAYFNNYASIRYQTVSVDTLLESGKPVILPKKTREFELKPDTLYQVHSDSLAQKRDSLYWAQVRTTALSEKEEVSYKTKDTYQTRFDSLRREDENRSFSWKSLLTGGKVGGRKSFLELKYGGLLGAFDNYNYVDGFVLGQRLDLTARFDSVHRLIFSPFAHYTTARRAVQYGFETEYRYAPLRQGSLKFAAASQGLDFNPTGITKWENTMYSFFAGENWRQFYDSRFASLTNSIDLANGLKFTAEGKIEKRSELQNNTSFYFKIGEKSLWDYMVWRKAENRIVPNRTMEQISYLTGIDLQLAYCPFSYYTVDRGEKHYRYLSAPLFRLRYRQGFDILENKNNSLFHSIDFNVSQSIRLSYFDNFSYDFSAGTFLGDVSKTDFIDYRHFNASGVLLGSKPVQNGFVLLDPYSHSTSKYWGALHLNYRTQYLLLKRIPFLQRMLFTENLHLKALYTPDKPFYTEAGYSINMMNIVSLSAFTAFNDFEYQKICFSISLSFAFLGL